MTRDPLIRAWALLIVLSLAGVGVTVLPDHKALAVVVLALSLAKARLILHRYLGLAVAPRWRRGFDSLILGFVALIAVLALIG